LSARISTPDRTLFERLGQWSLVFGLPAKERGTGGIPNAKLGMRAAGFE
jgi:hypothetical protein